MCLIFLCYVIIMFVKHCIFKLGQKSNYRNVDYIAWFMYRFLSNSSLCKCTGWRLVYSKKQWIKGIGVTPKKIKKVNNNNGQKLTYPRVELTLIHNMEEQLYKKYNLHICMSMLYSPLKPQNNETSCLLIHWKWSVFHIDSVPLLIFASVLHMHARACTLRHASSSYLPKSDRSHVVLWAKELSGLVVFLRPLGLRLTTGH